MAAPIISASSSILGFKRNETFAFQPSATNNPTSWTQVGLPAGLSINAATGLVSGSVAVSGVYVVTLAATNADPATGSREFVFGISSEVAASVAASDTSEEWDIDVVSREVTPGAAAFWKQGDVVLVRMRFRKNGVVVDPAPTSLRLVLKQFEPEKVLVVATGFDQIGVDEAAYFDLPVDLSGDALEAALADYEKDEGTFFEALAEIEWVRSVTHNGSPLTLRSSSRTFPVRIERDLAE